MRAGETVVIHDDRLCMAVVPAEAVDSGVITDFALNARGVIVVAMAPDRLDALEIPAMEGSQGSQEGGGYAVSVDAINGTTTGISAADRAATVKALLADEPDGQLAVPGHIFPIRTAKGGVLEQPGIAEAAVALAELAGLRPIVAACGILDADGSELRPENLARHPIYSSLIAISPALVRAHCRGLASLPATDPDAFREAMSLHPCGVGAITTRDADGSPRGLLATALTSYTDDPPSLLISLSHSSRTHDPLTTAVGIGVHILAHDQANVASVLASKADDKFADLLWSWDGDVPKIEGALAYMRCVRAETFVHYDHTILIADVEVSESDDVFPLLYFQRSLGWHVEHAAA